MSSLPALRQQLRARRRAVTAEQAQVAAQRLLQQFLHFPAIAQWRSLAVYLADDGEIDLSLVIRWCWQQQKVCYLPVVASSGEKILQFAPYTAATPLVANRYHILQPAGETSLSVHALDAVLLPLVAFDAQGNRLGRGGGYYDATLANIAHKPFLLGAGYHWQQVTALAPTATDVKLQGVITDNGLLAF